MTTLDITLYADGALRLTDHGPRGGGLVLVDTVAGDQIDVPSDLRPIIEAELEHSHIAGAGATMILARARVRQWRERHPAFADLWKATLA